MRWALAMLRNCTAARYEINKRAWCAWPSTAATACAHLRAATGIAYDERMQGTLQLFRTQKQLDGSASDIAILQRERRRPSSSLDRDGCIRHEPALARVREKFVGGLRLPGDETGDCFKFTQRLAALATERGVEFRFGTTIRSIGRSGDRVGAVVVDDGAVLEADAYLVALGSYSPLLLAPLGLRLPIYPVKGYSITVPIIDAAGAPESTVMDETHKVAVTRLGDRIRVGGTAELAGYTLQAARGAAQDARARRQRSLPRRRRRRPGRVLVRPAADDAGRHAGDRRDAVANLFLATGHGTLGWTMAAGTGRVMADVISGRPPAIDLDGLTIARYRGARRSPLTVRRTRVEFARRWPAASSRITVEVGRGGRRAATCWRSSSR